MTLTQDASKGGVPEQRLLKKTLVKGRGGGTIYIYIYICMVVSFLHITCACLYRYILYGLSVKVSICMLCLLRMKVTSTLYPEDA